MKKTKIGYLSCPRGSRTVEFPQWINKISFPGFLYIGWFWYRIVRQWVVINNSFCCLNGCTADRVNALNLNFYNKTVAEYDVSGELAIDEMNTLNPISRGSILGTYNWGWNSTPVSSVTNNSISYSTFKDRSSNEFHNYIWESDWNIDVFV